MKRYNSYFDACNSAFILHSIISLDEKEYLVRDKEIIEHEKNNYLFLEIVHYQKDLTKPTIHNTTKEIKEVKAPQEEEFINGAIYIIIKENDLAFVNTRFNIKQFHRILAYNLQVSPKEIITDEFVLPAELANIKQHGIKNIKFNFTNYGYYQHSKSKSYIADAFNGFLKKYNNTEESEDFKFTISISTKEKLSKGDCLFEVFKDSEEYEGITIVLKNGQRIKGNDLTPSDEIEVEKAKDDYPDSGQIKKLLLSYFIKRMEPA